MLATLKTIKWNEESSPKNKIVICDMVNIEATVKHKHRCRIDLIS